MITNAEVTDFVRSVKSDGDGIKEAARRTMYAYTNRFIAILAHALADVYEAEPWEVAIAIYGREGLSMSTEVSVQALKNGLGLSASDIAKTFRELGFSDRVCKYLLEKESFPQDVVEKAIKDAFDNA
jgi:hypothetical protein